MGWVCLLLGTKHVEAQSFILTLTNTPSPVTVGSNLTYSLSVSNATGFNLNPGLITSEYGSNAEFVAATNLYGFTNTPGRVEFAIPQNAFPANGVIEVFLALRGTNVGLVTNRFTVAIADDGRTEPAITNVISTIAPPPSADLGITILGPANGVFPGDAFNYQLLASNAGPSSAGGVVVSNPFPAQVRLISLSPTGSVTLVNGVVRFSVGTLTNQGAAVATISVRATNAAPTNLISATISTPEVTDTNPANNSFTLNVPILAPDTNQIRVAGLSAQAFNQQTGWMEQRVQLTNAGPASVDAVRLLVEGLTNQLVNATGTNGTTPYVVHGAPLTVGTTLEFTLEYFNPTRTVGGDPTLTAYGTPPVDLVPQSGTGITVDRMVQMTATNLNQGRMLLEWPATGGARYQVVYDEQATFSSAKGSLPVIVTPLLANRIQWLDYGPPRTLTAPSNAPARFYQVIQLP